MYNGVNPDSTDMALKSLLLHVTRLTIRTSLFKRIMEEEIYVVLTITQCLCTVKFRAFSDWSVRERYGFVSLGIRAAESSLSSYI